jgi:hypothetical protein
MIDECSQYGIIKKLIVRSPQLPVGSVAVTFESEVSANNCSSKMSGRWFDGRKLETIVYSPNDISVSGNPNEVPAVAIKTKEVTSSGVVISSKPVLYKAPQSADLDIKKNIDTSVISMTLVPQDTDEVPAAILEEVDSFFDSLL